METIGRNDGGEDGDGEMALCEPAGAEQLAIVRTMSRSAVKRNGRLDSIGWRLCGVRRRDTMEDDMRRLAPTIMVRSDGSSSIRPQMSVLYRGGYHATW